MFFSARGCFGRSQKVRFCRFLFFSIKWIFWYKTTTATKKQEVREYKNLKLHRRRNFRPRSSKTKRCFDVRKSDNDDEDDDETTRLAVCRNRRNFATVAPVEISDSTKDNFPKSETCHVLIERLNRSDQFIQKKARLGIYQFFKSGKTQFFKFGPNWQQSSTDEFFSASSSFILTFASLLEWIIQSRMFP